MKVCIVPAPQSAPKVLQREQKLTYIALANSDSTPHRGRQVLLSCGDGAAAWRPHLDGLAKETEIVVCAALHLLAGRPPFASVQSKRTDPLGC